MLLLGLVCLGSFGKVKHEMKLSKDASLLPASNNLKLGQFLNVDQQPEWLSNAYDNLKSQALNNDYYNKARDYSQQAATYVNEVVTNSSTVQTYKGKASDLKEKLSQKFDQWITSRIDQQKLQKLSQAAKKQFWENFINEVIDEEFDYSSGEAETQNVKPALTQSVSG